MGFLQNLDILMTSKVLLSNPLTGLFSWITRLFFNYFGNYGIAIIALTVLIRLCLIPLNISSQRSMIKTQALASKQDEIKRKYPNDEQKQREEIAKMMSENGAMSLSGCLLPILQIVFIWPIFRIVSGPLQHLSQVTVENLKSIAELASSRNLVDSSIVKMVDTNDISLIKLFYENSDFLRECISKGYIKAGQLLDLHFLGLDLTMSPAWNPVTIIKEPGTYLPLLVIPVLVLATTILSMKLTNWLKPGYKEEKIAKERAKRNAAMAGQQPQADQAEMMTKMMNYTMPAIMLITTFSMPAAMGVYWVIGSIMGIITQFIVYYLFTKPYHLKKLEMAELKKQAFYKNTDKSNVKKANSKKKKN